MKTIFFLMILIPLAVFAQGDGLTKEQIRGTIRKNLKSVVGCYESELKANPDLKGKVVVDFDIGLEGQVVRALIARSALHNPAAESCITEAIKTWQFPKPAGVKIVNVHYPFVFGKTKH